jgi:hypothetical protein
MGLSRILNIEETTGITPDSQTRTEYVVTFLTEETSGSKTIRIPEDEFTPAVARQRAESRAEELDAAFAAPDDGDR